MAKHRSVRERKDFDHIQSLVRDEMQAEPASNTNGAHPPRMNKAERRASVTAGLGDRRTMAPIIDVPGKSSRREWRAFYLCLAFYIVGVTTGLLVAYAAAHLHLVKW